MRIKLFESFEVSNWDELESILQVIFDDYPLLAKTVQTYYGSMRAGSFVEYLISCPTTGYWRDDCRFIEKEILSKVKNLKQRCESIGFEYPIYYYTNGEPRFQNHTGYVLQFKKIE